MKPSKVVREMRANLDRDSPGWREELRRDMRAENPRGGWTAMANVQAGNGENVEVAILAEPSEVSVGPLDDETMAVG